MHNYERIVNKLTIQQDGDTITLQQIIQMVDDLKQ